ncbi:MAG: AzlD domain-containing protein [Pelagibacterium sp.]|mgnify:FL=1|jgi:branched-subunit amino acid transport protein AzlD|uniref:AzlD domain-containing protein n=1 Tax=Pelagibacterium sp. TaxID=1967288 RepID=UPI0032EF74C2|tara:strand:- start:11980 stop:12300 length:321 start_codon:yes stop_codon:yes gene_type:complete
MNTEFLIITLLVGLGTWMLRFLPTRFMRGTGDPDAPLSRFLSATGPAAIAALYVGAILPMVSPDLQAIAPLVLGSAAVVAIYFWRRDVSLATLGGAIVYGIVFAMV